MCDKVTGYTNYPTLQIALHIGNSQGLTETWEERARELLAQADLPRLTVTGLKDRRSPKVYAIATLAEHLADAWMDDLERGLQRVAPLDPFDAIYRWAFEIVNWKEIATEIVNDVLAGEVEEDGMSMTPFDVVVMLTSCQAPTAVGIAYVGAENGLDYLESIDIRNEAWATLVVERLLGAQTYVTRLRDFIALKPGLRVDRALTPIVDAYQERIDALRARAQEVTS